MFDKKIEDLECKKSSEEGLDLRKSDTTQSDLNEENDTDEVEEESGEEIPCSQMKRVPHIWRKLDRETGEEQEGQMSEQGESQEESQEEGAWQEECDSQEEIETDW